MKLISFTIIITSIFLASCSKPAQISSSNVDANPKPSWVKMRPIDGSHYTGIAVASKRYAPDYQAVAKKNALFDLASEIKVNINSSSILYTIEKNESLKEEYLSNVKTSTSQSLEGYELVGNWEDENDYWVYYKLNKLKHQEIQKKKKDAAISLAFEHFKNAKNYEANKNILLASSYYIQGLQSLENYLGEKNNVTYKNNTIDLGSRLSSDLQKLLAEISLSTNPNLLSIKRGFKDEHKSIITATYDKKPAQEIPLTYHFITGEGELNSGTATNSNGKANIVVQKISSQLKNQEIGVGIDKQALAIKSGADNFMALWLGSLPSQGTKLILNVSNPKIFVASTEKNLGKNTKKGILKNETQNLLSKEGFEFTQSISKADMILSIDSDTEKGASNNGINVSYLNASFQLLSKENQELYSKSLTRVKGVQLNYEQAGLNAYTNSVKKLKRSIINDMVKSLF